ncbi:hypothetical protein OAO65_02115 [Flavobacteriales bacterium]|nr:hypothetical protein [Flavobacteriales bacterium]
MKKHQIKWASQHAWFIEALPDNSILVEGDQFTVLRFDDFDELYIWAGY